MLNFILILCVASSGDLAWTNPYCKEIFPDSSFKIKTVQLIKDLAKYLGIATWEIVGTPVRMLLPFAQDEAVTQARKEYFAVTGRSFLNYVLRLELNSDHLIGKRILDLGSGRSLFVPIVNGLYGKRGTQAIAIDRFVQNSQIGGGQFISADMRKLPFKDHAFDLVVSVWSMNYFATKSQRQSLVAALKEAIRVTQSGGEVRITYDWGIAARYFREALEEIAQTQAIDYEIGWVNPLFLISATGVVKIKVH